MTPMIDVVFLLLVFFLVTASFQEPEGGLAASVIVESKPGAGGSPLDAPPPDLDEVLVVGTRSGNAVRWTVGERRAADAAELATVLRDLAAVARDLPVTIDAGPDVPLGSIVEAYDAARAAGLPKVRLAASADSIGAATAPADGGAP
jgi:biopolymer transport protein ExbD